MSNKVYFTPYTNFFRTREDINGMEKILWLTLANHAGIKGYCYPSLKTLEKEIGLGQKAIQRYLFSLEKKGGIYICNRYDKTTNAKLSNRYYVIDLIYETGQFDESLLEPLKILYPDKKIFE